jgi:hypothetical protein
VKVVVVGWEIRSRHVSRAAQTCRLRARPRARLRGQSPVNTSESDNPADADTNFQSSLLGLPKEGRMWKNEDIRRGRGLPPRAAK